MKLQYLGYLMGRTDSLEKTLILGNTESRRRGGQTSSLTQWTWVWVSSGSWWWTEKPGVLQSLGSQRIRHDWVTELNSMFRVSHVALVIKNPSANAGGIRDMDSVPGLGIFPGGEGMATHSSILTWRIPWTKEPGSL